MSPKAGVFVAVSLVLTVPDLMPFSGVGPCTRMDSVCYYLASVGVSRVAARYCSRLAVHEWVVFVAAAWHGVLHALQDGV
jgi:hypothetical protein